MLIEWVTVYLTVYSRERTTIPLNTANDIIKIKTTDKYKTIDSIGNILHVFQNLHIIHTNI